MSTESTTTETATDMAALYRDLLTAIHETLDVPRPPIGEHEKAMRLRYDRATAILGALDGLLAGWYGPEIAAETLRHSRDTYHAVNYATAQAEAETHPADCVVCGPGCCSPVLGVHTSCPGPLVGRMASVR